VGTCVTISGANFTGATSVTFGTAAATGVSVISDTQINVTSPAGTGTVDVTVTTPNGPSATGASDRYTYQQPSVQTPPPAPPQASTNTVTPTSTTGAGFAGTVNPEGSPTTYFFEYGLDPSVTGAPVSYDGKTTPQTLGAGTAPQSVSASTSGLVPNALYHVRLVAQNSAGTTVGPDQTFKTAADAPPPPPVLGQTEVAKPVGGPIFLIIAGKKVPLTEVKKIPNGTVLDTRQGTLQITAATATGRKELATFTGAVFKVIQSRSGLTNLTLVLGGFPGAPTLAACTAKKASASIARLSRRVLQPLRGRDRGGHFRTSGRFSAATVFGTVWDTSDRCDGTLTTVHQGTVIVNDFTRHKNITVHAGHSYLASAKRG